MSKRKPKKNQGRKGRAGRSRKFSRLAGFALVAFIIAWGWAGVWFVHHPRKWIERKCESYPAVLTAALTWIGNPVGDITDAFGWTGHDAVYEYDEEAPSGSVLFAGAPRRMAPPAASDITVIDRGDFIIGWSDSLRHPVWCAYHVTKDAVHENAKRPGFTKDRQYPAAPSPDAYTGSGYDRGHMVPNYAIVTRYGTDAQKLTFRMTNITPQTPALNRGVWRDFEHRIADLWTRRYGEIWVIAGSVSNPDYAETVSGSDIDVPTHYYQIIVAQEGMNIRALAVIFPQTVSWRAWAARSIVSIDELEEITGFDFLPDLPGFIQDPLEAELPSRLWPIDKRDIFKLVSLRLR
jgi:endonuclease G